MSKPKLHVFEVTFETKEIIGNFTHTRKILAESCEEACKLIKGRVKRIDGKRAYKCKARRCDDDD